MSRRAHGRKGSGLYTRNEHHGVQKLYKDHENNTWRSGRDPGLVSIKTGEKYFFYPTIIHWGEYYREETLG